MADEAAMTSITRADIEATAARLDAFVDTLTDQERNVLAWIVARAQMAPEPGDDVGGYLLPASPQLNQRFSTPLAAQLGQAAGLGFTDNLAVRGSSRAAGVRRVGAQTIILVGG
jgi:hypothetical protein